MVRRAGWRVRALAAAAAGVVLPASLLIVGIESAARILPAPDLAKAGLISPLVLDEQGIVLRGFLSQDDRWRLTARPEDLPKPYLDMVIAWEDKRFFRHSGVDPWAGLRAIYLSVRHGRPVSGASTITMQLARLLEGGRRSFFGKVRQIVVARQLERRLGKTEILALYLSLAPFGGNIEGVRAASLAYFRKEPSLLNVGESALLVALPQAPETRRPDRAPALAESARNRVLKRMAETGIISFQAAAEARNQPVSGRRTIAFSALHLADRLRRQSGRSGIVRTLIDAPLQGRIEVLAAAAVARLPAPANAAVLVVRNRDMAIRSYLGGADYFAEERVGQVDLVRARRSPGSTLKPFIYGMAFEQRWLHPQTIITDAAVQFGGYEPSNFSGTFDGDMSVREALIRSINTGPVKVLARLTPQRFATRLHLAGAELSVGESGAEAGLAIGLGGAGITLFNLVKLYAGLANGGEVRDLRFSRTDAIRPARRLLEGDAAWALADILADMPPPPGFMPRLARDGGRRIAYKTGTSYGFRDAWAIGFDHDHTVGVWFGHPDGTPHAGAYGSTVAAPLLMQIMDLLPVPERAVASPRRTTSLLAPREDLPEHLVRFGAKATAPEVRPLKIIFPVESAEIVIDVRNGKTTPLPLTAQGGTPPYQWFADLRPVGEPTSEAKVWWTPPGHGATRLTVFDAAGRRQTLEIWITRP